MLVAVQLPDQDDARTQDLLRELGELATTFGAAVIEARTVKVRKAQSRYLVGSGNAVDIAQTCHAKGIRILVFDNSLSPSQQRNWERLTSIRVIDRHELILDIFAARASTKEAVLQIELARMEYMLPRLKRAWTHLSRQQGGLGLRGGEGEKQIEVDERIIRRRIAKLQKDIRLVKRRRIEQRKKRLQKPVPNAAIVGYTNAGKSSLLNALTKAGKLVENKLFATLDPTTRRLRVDSQTILVTDTVGFIRNLPHDLVDAFKATLEESAIATFLIHVVDVNSAFIDEHLRTTETVLREINAYHKFTLTVFNKIDLVTEPYLIPRVRKRYPGALFISARTGAGIPELLARIQEYVDEEFHDVELKLPPDRYDLVALIHRTGKIKFEKFENDSIYVRASIPRNCRCEFVNYAASRQ